jgi:hypothetical protein
MLLTSTRCAVTLVYMRSDIHSQPVRRCVVFCAVTHFVPSKLIYVLLPNSKAYIPTYSPTNRIFLLLAQIPYMFWNGDSQRLIACFPRFILSKKRSSTTVNEVSGGLTAKLLLTLASTVIVGSLLPDGSGNLHNYLFSEFKFYDFINFNIILIIIRSS